MKHNRVSDAAVVVGDVIRPAIAIAAISRLLGVGIEFDSVASASNATLPFPFHI